MKVKLLSHVRLFVNPWTVAYQAAPSMGFSRQESWSGVPFPSPGDLPNPGIEPRSPALQADTLPSEPPGKPSRQDFFFLNFKLEYIVDLQCCVRFRCTAKRFSHQFSSVAQSCPTLCDPLNLSMPGLPVRHQLLEFTQTHVHRVSDAIQPSHPLSSPSPPAPNPSQHQGLFQLNQLFT